MAARELSCTALPAHFVEIEHQGNVFQAQESVRLFAQSIGFTDYECDQMAIVVSELSNNLIKHAGGGKIRFGHLTNNDYGGIRIETEDNGPGFKDFDKSLTDGYSTSGGFGIGLGVVNRLMDDLDIVSPVDGSTHIICQRWLRPRENIFPHAFLEIGVASRPRYSENENGDAFVVKCWGHHTLIGVIDGLGHGSLAHQASLCARLYIEDHFDRPLETIFKGVDRACRATRGVVMALALFNMEEDVFYMANIGNIEIRLKNHKPSNFVIRRGIVGLNAPSAVITKHPWTKNSLLVMHSDGLHTHWEWNDYPAESWDNPSEISRILLSKQGKDNDDATIIVVKNAKRE